MSVLLHKKQSPRTVSIGIITVSSTRTVETDKSGAWIKKLTQKEGHRLDAYLIVPDNQETIHNAVMSLIHEQKIQVLIITGGTGISPQDVTIEAVAPLFSKEMSAFNALFAQLSFEQIHSAALLSRATAGIIAQSIVFCIPGSLKAVKLACYELIFPELGHLVKHVSERNISSHMDQ